MNELFIAITNHFKLKPLEGFYLAIEGRLYLNVAPQEATFPYCVYFIVTDSNDPDFTDDHEEFEMQFNIFSENNSAVEAGSLLSSLKEMFDYAPLNVEGWSNLDFRRTMVLPNNDFLQVPPIQGYSIMYDVLLEKKRD